MNRISNLYRQWDVRGVRVTALSGYRNISRIAAAAAGCLVVGTVLAQTATDPKDADDALEEIVVTGTSLRGEQPVGSSLVSVGRTEIENTGAPNMADLLQEIPLINNFNGVPRPGLGAAVGVATTPGLRNLDSNATLVLLDGFRMIGENPLDTTTDPSSIPPAAVERVEIVADGASGIYGSDAVAGVINVILRKDLDGAETSIRYNWADHDYDAIDLSQAFGKTWSTGSAMFVIGYNKNSNIFNADLPYYTNNLVPFGGTDLRPINCAEPNVILDGVTYTPPGYQASAAAARCEPSAQSDSVPEFKRTSIIANARQEISDNLHLFGLIRYTDTEVTNLTTGGGTNATLTTTNPFFFRPAGATGDSETVLMDTSPFFGQNANRAESKSSTLVLGADYYLPRDFRLQATFNYGHGENNAHQPSFNAAALGAAAAGTTPDTALDPFGGNTSPAVVAQITDFENYFGSEQDLYDYQLKLDGSLFELSGGEVKVAVGVDYRKYVYDAENTVGQIGQNQNRGAVSADRTVTAVFAEVLLPLVSESNAMPFVYSLSLSGAIRYDDYNDFGDTTNPKIGAIWSPVKGLDFRGSYGTSFHAPDMGDSYAVDTRALYFANFPLVPPGSPPLDTIALAGGNPGLQPEDADTYSFGVDFAPSWLSGFQGSITYWNISYKNLVGTAPISPEIFTNPAYEDFYVENPTRAQIDEIAANFRLVGTTAPIPDVALIIDLRRQNLGAIDTDGFDFGFSYGWDTNIGDFTASISGTHVLGYDLIATPGSPAVEVTNFIDDRWRAELGWRDGPVSAGIAWNHSGEYDQTYNLPQGGTAVQSVDSFDPVNLRASYEFSELGILSGLLLSLNINNVLDEEPPMRLAAGGFSTFASPMGRSIWAGVDIAW
ncbi:MAG TPA: TonB-dependent receptor [Woeseiaceae bacterium]|nr:TonB-dependent receptor [Woeseiaceae bacterium]